jgi:DNA ligase D-like protein (predicted ligase)
MERIAPMLAVAAEPFDSPEHLFEIKWDGVRALAAVEQEAWRLWGRHGADYTDRYPELSVLRQLPAGTMLDGELIRLVGGRADFSALLRRHQLASARKIRWAAAQQPVTYVVFDLLRLGGRSLLEQPLHERRGALLQLLSGRGADGLPLSDGVVGMGRQFFERAVAQGHEGVMAKRLDSRYCPGRRSPDWQKIKPRQQAVCVILGYRSARGPSVSRLLVAARRDGGLHYAGEVGCGLTDKIRHQLHPLLVERHCDRPLVSCGAKHARWVRPELYCLVQFFGWTSGGRLRFPCFRRLLPGGERP